MSSDDAQAKHPQDNNNPPASSADAVRSNRLAQENSAYLRQHMHNPINWFPWGAEALDKAKQEDKPIFLSVGYSSCHWCHVMEHESFEDDEVAAFLNEKFVSIKVDREERPDIDGIYMEAVQRLTGSGGWPMSVFLTPAQKPFFGGTYFPKEHFLALSKRVIEAWQSQREALETDADMLARMIGASFADFGGDATGSAPGRNLAEGAVEATRQSFDNNWGGDGQGVKFPTPPVWSLCLRLHRKSGSPEAAHMLRLTLDKMADGGIHDHVGGGFHRYTVEPTWLVPHFEKMLYDNAQLATLYLEAAVALQEPHYEEVARGTLDFMIRDLSGTPGEVDVANTHGIYGSYDADSEGHEGLFYLFTPEQLREAVTDETDAAGLAKLLDVRPGGNFEGRTILTRRVEPKAAAQELGRDEAELAGLFEKWRETLYQHRAKRIWPALDRKVVTAWNGMAISAFAKGYQLFGEPRYRQAAEQTAAYLKRVNRDDATGRLFRASTDEVPSGTGVLDDYACLARGLLELFQVTGALDHFDWAKELIEMVESHFAGPQPGSAYYFTPDDVDAPLGRQVELIDSVEPSGNAAMLHAQLLFAALTADREVHGRVGACLAKHGEVLVRTGSATAAWLEAVLLHEGPMHELVVAGSDEGETQALWDTWRTLLAAHTVAVRLAPDGADHEALAQRLPGTADKHPEQETATAWVCQYGACQQPTSDPATLHEQLLTGWSR